MTRRKPRSGHGDGLFAWTPDGDVVPTEIHANPLTVPCRHPTCRAKTWWPCVNHRGRPLTAGGFHDSRRDDADANLQAHERNQPHHDDPTQPPGP